MDKKKEKIVEKQEEINEEKKKPSKTLVVIFIIFMSLVLLGIGGIIIYNALNGGSTSVKPTLEPLPKAEADPSRGDFGVDKNINIDTIDKYLGRSDTVYRDMRMLEDPAIYENLGGNRYLNGYIKGFEVIPLPYIIPVNGLPVEVGQTYEGITLFYEQDGKYIANYEESMEILEKYFPKDKNIFLMCGGGGYAFMMKNFLIAMGWDTDKIYNIGGYWYYKGENNVDLTRDNGTYDFDSAPYIEINFNELTKSAAYKDSGIRVTSVSLSSDTIELEERLTYNLFAYVLPNLASNKEVTWSSSNEKVATVSETGVVKGVKEGSAIITVTTKDGGFTASCTVTITKRIENKINADDVSSENKEFSNVGVHEIELKYNKLFYGDDNILKYDYNDPTYIKLRDQRIAELEPAITKEATILKKLVDNKKSFIIIYNREMCGDRPYNIYERAPEVLKSNNYSFIDVEDDIYLDSGSLLDKVGFDKELINDGSLIVVKEGQVIASLNPDFTVINNEADFKAWITKYIDLK